MVEHTLAKVFDWMSNTSVSCDLKCNLFNPQRPTTKSSYLVVAFGTAQVHLQQLKAQRIMYRVYVQNLLTDEILSHSVVFFDFGTNQ